MADRLTMIVQQIDEKLGRAPRLAATSTYSDLTIPDPEAGKLVGWNSGGTDFANFAAADVDLAAVSTFMATVLDDTTAVAALATLGAANLTAVNTFTKTQRWTKGADIASAATVVLGTDGNYFDITGNTGPIATITVAAGTFFMWQFDSTPTLTHHATNLDLPGGADITAAAGDVLLGFATAANQVHVVTYTRADGTAVVSAGGTKEFFIPFPSATTVTDTTWAAKLMNITNTGVISWFMPNDFTTLTEAVIPVLPDATETIQWDIATHFGAVGEDESTHTDSAANATSAVTDDQIAELDISGELTGVAANDYVGLLITADITAIQALGVRIKYS